MIVRIFFIILALFPIQGFSQNAFCYKLKGEVLYWQANLSSQFIRENTGVQTPLDFCWCPGFRVSAGFFPRFLPFATDLSWTHYKGKAEKKIPWQAPYLGALTGLWHLHLDSFDLSFSKPLCLAKMGEIRPFLGVRVLRLKQHSELDHLGELFTVTTFKSRYLAGGARLGCEATYMCTNSLSFYFKGSYSLLYGNFHNRQEVTITDFDEIEEDYFGKYHLFLSRNGADFALGVAIRPAKSVLCNPLIFHLSFEHSIFPFQWATFNQEGLLSVYGGSLSIDFYF